MVYLDIPLHCGRNNAKKGTNEMKRQLISLKRKEIADILFPMLKNCVSSSYAQSIMDEILDAVVHDVDEAADPENWNDDDVRLACGRAILAKLRLYQEL